MKFHCLLFRIGITLWRKLGTELKFSTTCHLKWMANGGGELDLRHIILGSYEEGLEDLAASPCQAKFAYNRAPS